MATQAKPAPQPSHALPQAGLGPGDGLPSGLISQGRLGLNMLIGMRWVLLGGELAVVLVAELWRGARLPLIACLTVIAIGAGYNLFLALARPGRTAARDSELASQLGFNILQLSAILFLTGGVANPFTLLLITPVTLAAATLRGRHALVLGALAAAAVVALTLWWLPIDWRIAPPPPVAPTSYRWLMATAILTGIVATAGYAWRAAAEATRMELALNVTQTVLAREQRLSALGGLAAAAAHELGTPLATIQVVTKEMIRSLEPGPLFDDVQLLIEQAERCRAILRKLSQEPDTADAHHARMSLSQLLDEVADPHRDGVVVIDCEVSCAPGAAILEVQRMPEVLHGLSAFVENAVDFAESAVDLTAYYDDAQLIIEVRDDGPGFSADVIGKLGQPYITTRSQGENSRSSHLGMGLGFFIAKTLLERTGALVEFRNAKRGGACITARWTRERIAVQEPV